MLFRSGRSYEYTSGSWDAIPDCCIRVSENTGIVSQELTPDGCLIFASIEDAIAAGRNQLAIRDGDHSSLSLIDLSSVNGNLYIEIMLFASVAAGFIGVESLHIDGSGSLLVPPNGVDFGTGIDPFYNISDVYTGPGDFVVLGNLKMVDIRGESDWRVTTLEDTPPIKIGRAHV